MITTNDCPAVRQATVDEATHASGRTRAVSDGDIWMLMTSLVFDHRGAWRSQVIETTGLPFSRFRALRRLDRRPLSARDLAQLLDIDAAATSVIVADLDERGLVQRQPDPKDARRKIITITDAGHAVLQSVRTLNGTPAFTSALSPTEVSELHRLLGIVLETQVGAEAHPTSTVTSQGKPVLGSHGQEAQVHE